ncbi:hypothetical protein JCM4914_73410 [Streptomyces platensis subsp. malvinus]
MLQPVQFGGDPLAAAFGIGLLREAGWGIILDGIRGTALEAERRLRIQRRRACPYVDSARPGIAAACSRARL